MSILVFWYIKWRKKMSSKPSKQSINDTARWTASRGALKITNQALGYTDSTTRAKRQ